MAVTIASLCEIMEEFAPLSYAYDFDNVGLIIGQKEQIAERVLLALDVSDAVVEEAIQLGAQMIIAHHPLIFKPIKRIDSETALGRRITKLIKNDIAVYASHTNLDVCDGGTNDTLFELLELQSKEPLEATENASMGRVGRLKDALSLEEFSVFVKEKLKLKSVTYIGNPRAKISTIGLCTGSGGDPKLFALAKGKGCDGFVTGDVTYHNAQSALEMGLSVIDATHYATETIVAETIKRLLGEKMSALGETLCVHVSKVDGQVFNVL